MFFQCMHIQSFWHEVESTLTGILGIHIKVSVKQIIFGVKEGVTGVPRNFLFYALLLEGRSVATG